MNMKQNWKLGAVFALALACAAGCASNDANQTRGDVMDLSDSPTPGRAAGARSPFTPAQAEPTPEPIAEAPAAPAAPAPRKHVVAAKDTLYGLATKYYGDSKQWPKIQKANPGLVPERMPVGKAIVIP